MGNVWRVKASAEESSSGDGWTELSSNGNGAARAGHVQSPDCTGNSVGACDFATLGEAFPHGTMLVIKSTVTGRQGTFPLTDIGNGSSFAPAIGLTPHVQGALGWNGEDVLISLADGRDLNVVSGFGQLGGGSIGTPDVPTLDTANYVDDVDPSKDIRDIADQCTINGSRAWNHAEVIRELVATTHYITIDGPKF